MKPTLRSSPAKRRKPVLRSDVVAQMKAQQVRLPTRPTHDFTSHPPATRPCAVIEPRRKQPVSEYNLRPPPLHSDQLYRGAVRAVQAHSPEGAVAGKAPTEHLAVCSRRDRTGVVLLIRGGVHGRSTSFASVHKNSARISVRRKTSPRNVGPTV